MYDFFHCVKILGIRSCWKNQEYFSLRRPEMGERGMASRKIDDFNRFGWRRYALRGNEGESWVQWWEFPEGRSWLGNKEWPITERWVSSFKNVWRKNMYYLGGGKSDQESDNCLPDRILWRGLLHWEGIWIWWSPRSFQFSDSNNLGPEPLNLELRGSGKCSTIIPRQPLKNNATIWIQ